MLEALVWIVVGAFIGWHFPEPSWARKIKEKITSNFK